MSSSLLCIHNQPKDSRCIGSSHGWLILLKQETTPYLFNPCSGFQIQLPSNAGLQQQAGRLVRKAVLSADPCKNKEYVVIVIYGFESKIGLFRMSTGWRDLDGKHMSDVICRNNMLFTLDERCNIGVWDFRRGGPSSSFPIKVRDIRPSFPRKDFDNWGSMKDLCSCRWYVVESSGDFWVVCRVVGEYVRDGVAIYEAELLEGETNHPLVCPYKTLNFKVYRLERQKNEWEEVETIGDRIIFLGGNHSVSVTSHELANHNHNHCRTNSIYFTDDYWDRINEDYLYGGHDLGVYSMEDKSVKDVYQFDLDRIEPPPFWVLPSQC